MDEREDGRKEGRKDGVGRRVTALAPGGGRDKSKVSFALDENNWVCAKWMLHSTRPVTIPVLNAEWEWRRGSLETVECSNHFGHT